MGINWSNILYPENEKKREEIIRLVRDLFKLLQRGCDATNLRIEAVERHLPGTKFSKIFIDKDKTIKSNCDVIEERLHEIEEYMKQHSLEVKCRTNPGIFKKLHSIDLSFLHKLDVAKMVITGSMNFGFSGNVLYQVGTILMGMTMTSLAASSFEKLCAYAYSIIIVIIIYLGVSLTTGAIIGAVEKYHLDAVLHKYKQAVDTFKSSADMFYDNISL